MAQYVKVVDADGEDGVLGQLPFDDVLYLDGHGAVIGKGATALEAMLGPGYRERRFHLMLPNATLEGCQVITTQMQFTYDGVRQYGGASDAPATQPDADWDLTADTANDHS